MKRHLRIRESIRNGEPQCSLRFSHLTGVSTRNHETSSLRTLSAYLKAIRPLLTLILMVPPVNTSAPLRASLLLRFTGETLEYIPGYPPGDLAELVEFLDELDKGWLAVLRSQMWDTATRGGVDMTLPAGSDFQPSPISQTDRTRLRSLFILGTDNLEEWLEDLAPPVDETETSGVVQSFDVRYRFDELFHRTLAEMGELQGVA